MLSGPVSEYHRKGGGEFRLNRLAAEIPYAALHLTHDGIQLLWMIQSFKDESTRELYESGSSRRWAGIRAVAQRKLDQIDAAASLNDLRIPPGNRLEALKRDRSGQHSIRINGQYRICLVWMDDGAHEVEITDYH